MRNRRTLRLESLEERAMMAADINLDNGVLQIEGTDQNDWIEIEYRYNNNEQIDEIVARIEDWRGNVLEE